MSLNKEQRNITAEELQAHSEGSTLSVQMIAGKLNVIAKDVEKALAMKAPLGIFSYQLQRFIYLVWDVRDVIDDDTKENGQTPEPCTYLKGEREDCWFLR